MTLCTRHGVKVVCIPQRGGKKTPEREACEKSSEFKQGQRFRAGIEGRVSVLFRSRGMKRCLAEGAERFELWVAAAVLANNRMNIAALLTRCTSRKTKNYPTTFGDALPAYPDKAAEARSITRLAVARFHQEGEPHAHLLIVVAPDKGARSGGQVRGALSVPCHPIPGRRRSALSDRMIRCRRW